jgi:ubiquinol-cytochrome c reductase cytochrome b/c1 subunit
VTAMFSAILLFAFLPWLDRSPVKSASYRPLYRIFFWIFVATAIGLGYIGANPPEGNYVIAGRILTISYFAFFLVVLPLLPFVEKPRPMPASIADSVLGKTASMKS